MSTVIANFYDDNGDPLAGLTPSFAAPGYYKTIDGVDAAPPVVTDIGGGAYSFTPSVTDEATGVTFILDGGQTALDRYYQDTIQPTAAAAAATTVSVTGVNLFGVTPEFVRRHHFPQLPGFSADSNPTEATLLEFLDDAAGDLEAALLRQSIDATALLVTNKAAYLWCRKTLALMVALEALGVMTGADPALAKAWQKRLDARLAALVKDGYLALGGGVTAPAEDSKGPTTHIQNFGLDSGSKADASDVKPIFRQSDEL